MKPVLLLILCTSLRAHDMWIQPANFSPAAGDIVSLRLLVGQDFLGDPLPRDPTLIRQFVVQDHAGRKPVIGRDGANPAGFIRVAEPGLNVVGYFSNPSSVEETAQQFNKYLTDEGLDTAAALRASRKQTGSNVRELFTRCAKTLVAADGTGGADTALGFTLELVAERNPYTLHAGEELPLRLTYESHPLAGALVIAMNRHNPADKIRARTGSDGRVKLRLPASGMWLVKAVHMVPAPPASQADWQSYWASLTFNLPGNAGGAQTSDAK
jgi:uncharacterized GH25 family protein